MVQKCPAKYKNLNYIQSFSEQGYATIQLMQQACMNDEWLRQRVLKLNYLTPPSVRKWYQNGEWIDDKLSYGYTINSDGSVGFNQLIEKRIYIDFLNDDDLIDPKTDVKIMSDVTNDTEIPLTTNIEESKEEYNDEGQYVEMDNNNEITGVVDDVLDVVPDVSYWCQLPFENEVDKYTYTTTSVTPAKLEVVDKTTSTITEKGGNSAWYIGFNKSKNYYVRPDWIKNWKDGEIPSVCRGQTFKANATGYLKAIDLKLDYNGTHSSDCGSPLYVQIWKTKKEKRKKQIWNNTTKEMEYVYKKHKNNTGGNYNKVNGKYKKVKDGTGAYSIVYEKVPVPDTKDTGIYRPLTQAIYNPSKALPTFGEVNIVFDKQVKLKKGQSYFIALFSPLSEWKHCPRWVGWGRNCKKDKKYEYGNAFLSEDNGRTWIRYGRNDSKVPYKQGRFVPQDFAFTCQIITQEKVDEETNVTETVVEDQIDDAGVGNPRYLYLKPIYCNPLTSIQISANHSVPEGTGIKYEYSLNGRVWNEVTLGITYNVNPFNDGSRPQVVFVRAQLYRDITTMEGNHQKYYKATPKIFSMNVILNTQVPKSMYVRTHEWKPRTEPMLGARIWGKVYAPFETDPTVSCSVDIVTNNTPTDHFTIIEVENVYDYCVKKEFDEALISPLKSLTEEGICEYLYVHQEIIELLKKYNIYIKPYVMTIDNVEYMYLLSFKPDDVDEMRVRSTSDINLGGLYIRNNVAYPILECTYTPENSTGSVMGLGEGYDYKFDYESSVLIFDLDVLNQLALGDIAIRYNECFIKGLSNDELAEHIDMETGLKEEGLILDYFKEIFVIDELNVETRRVKLRVEPVDPIREVVLNRDTESEIELFEGFDYVLDLDSNEIEFNVSNVDGVSSILTIGDTLEIVYTPNLQATGLSLGYWCTRENTDKQVRIKNSYWEYKA